MGGKYRFRGRHGGYKSNVRATGFFTFSSRPTRNAAGITSTIFRQDRLSPDSPSEEAITLSVYGTLDELRYGIGILRKFTEGDDSEKYQISPRGRERLGELRRKMRTNH